MSYNINISGHKDVENPQKFEEEVVQKAKDFVATLEGVSSATASTATLGTVDLKAG